MIRSIILCYDPYGVDNAGDKPQDGQQYIQPEMRFDTNGHKNTKRREDDSQYDSKYAHIACLRFVVRGDLFAKMLPLISCAETDTAGHSGYRTSAEYDNS